MKPLGLALFAGIIMFVILLFLILWNFAPNNKSLLKQKFKSEHNGFNDLYAKLIKKQPVEFAKKIGVDLAGYTQWCLITDTEPNYEKLILIRLAAIITLFIGAVIGVISLNVIVIMLFLCVAFALVFLPTYFVKKKAKEKLSSIRMELPRFLDMLSTALKVGIPIQNALKMTSQNCEGILGTEILQSITETELNASDWRKSLQMLAEKYNDNDFADFVLAVVIAYEKGNDITDVVIKKSEQLRKNTILKCKERSSKLSTFILLPLIFFKMIPLMVLLMLPLVIQITQNF